MNLDSPSPIEVERTIIAQNIEETVVLKRKRECSRSVSVKNFLLLQTWEKELSVAQFFSASAESVSNKPIERGIDEDRFDIERLPIIETESVLTRSSQFNTFYTAVFDGHGGDSVSEYAKQTLRKIFFKKYQEQSTTPIKKHLSESFKEVDEKLYTNLVKARETAILKKRFNCTCKFFLENPCACLNANAQAKAGSSGTVIVLKDNILNVANIGDSEACLFSFEKECHKNIEKGRKIVEVNTKESSYQALFAGNKLSAADASRIQTRLQSEFVNELCLSKEEPELTDNFIQLTTSHTPSTNSSCEDYKRISAIAGKRNIFRRTKQGPVAYDGIKRGLVERNNYVSFPGVHSLNMTRAFGNFGHKVYKQESTGPKLNINDSAVIPVPDVQTFDLAQYNNNCFLVAGSDGLWDNVSKAEVYAFVVTYVREHILDVVSFVNGAIRYKNLSTKAKGEKVLFILTKGVVKGLSNKAISAEKKLDDVTVVVVLFNTILSRYL